MCSSIPSIKHLIIDWSVHKSLSVYLCSRYSQANNLRTIEKIDRKQILFKAAGDHIANNKELNLMLKRERARRSTDGCIYFFYLDKVHFNVKQFRDACAKMADSPLLVFLLSLFNDRNR